MIKQVEQYINQFNMIESGDEIIAGVSGGADSVCMFLQLVEYQKKVPFTLRVVHINHLIREDAKDDATFVQKLCDNYKIEFNLFEEDVVAQAKELGLSTEEAGRRIRYIRFNEVCESENAKIAVAHNRNDVAETVLFNIFRGTGIEGLASLVPVNGNIIRPILCLSREDIEKYLCECTQTYKTDSTNITNDYARNKIRNVVLPFAEREIVNKATEHVAALSTKMALVRDYIKSEVDKYYDKVVAGDKNGLVININGFMDLDLLLRKEIVLRCFDELTQGRKDIGQIHVDAVLDLLNREGYKRTDLPYNLEAVKQYDQLYIRVRVANESNQKSYFLNGNDSIVIDNMTIKSRIISYNQTDNIPQNTYTKWFDYDKINGCLMIRNKRVGDYLTINDTLQKKSLKEYMINSKIPKELRDSQLVIADDSHILWVIGYRISEFYKVSNQTKNILEISVEFK